MPTLCACQHCPLPSHPMQALEMSPGDCSSVLPVVEWLGDSRRVMHPGVLPALVDLLTTAVLATVEQRQCVTVSIDVQFFGSLPVGEELLCEARVVKAGKTLTSAAIEFR